MKLFLRKEIGALMAATVLGFAAGASNVDTYSAFKVARYAQEGPTPGSVHSTSYTFGARVFANVGKSVMNATVTPPVGTVGLFERSGPISLDFYGGGFYMSKSDLDNAFPAGVYTFTATGEESEARLTIPDAELYPSRIPAFSAESWKQMQDLDAGRPATLWWNTFKTHALADAAFAFLRIYEDGSYSEPVYSVSYLAPSTHERAVPANVLKCGKRYRVELIFSNRADFPAAGFGRALATAGFDNLTVTTLVTGRPQLQFSHSRGGLQISWPVAGSDYVLEWSERMDGNDGWKPVQIAPMRDGERLVVHCDRTTAAKFFRLRKAG